MKLSIIIPIYKTENTLRRCVESILSQKFKDYEILLIDDGSPDSSNKIADEIANYDNRISVYHKDNGGQSDARNYGLDRAKGKYITFVDSDDTISTDTFMSLIEIIEKHPEYDILEYSFMERVGHKDERLVDLGEHVYTDSIQWLTNGGFNHCWVWNKIFKRRLFDDTRFPYFKFAEDLWLMGMLLKKNPMIATTSRGHYFYYWNENGTTANTHSYTDLLRGQLHIVEQFDIDTRHHEWHNLYMDMLNIQLYVYVNTGNIMLKPQRVVPRKYGGNYQGLIKALMLNIFGLRLTCRIFKFLRQIN